MSQLSRLSRRLDELLQGLVFDIRRTPFWYHIPRQVVPEFHG